MLNPISFRPGPVTFWTTVVYLALLIPVVIINESTPRAPRESPYESVNLTQAWLDLTTITKAYHPYNSHYNDEVRNFLLTRVASILDSNGVPWNTDDGAPPEGSDFAVTVFDDLKSNCTVFMGSGIGGVSGNEAPVGQAAYFEGTNILVYIRGKQDDSGSFWHADSIRETRHTRHGLTLVNAHYDSVSTGYGATDDGMGVVTSLQVIQHFSHPDNQPERGVVVMLNNGEEDWLYGARALGQSPIAPYIHTFLNLEGAGAGGRALLFRSTDREVTAAYAKTSDPFGTVIGSDAFGLGFIRSGTDYSVLHDVFGQRGLDLAFFKPRARYHTNQDDARHASRDSIWHMLSAAIHTTTALSSDTGDTFVGPRPDDSHHKVPNGSPSDGVWFDIFGKGFALFGLRAMFAWSLTILIAAPLILIILTYILHKLDRYYFFTSRVRTYDHEFEPVSVGGWKGFFRFPLALAAAGAVTMGAALLLRKVNPFIIYSSQYSVWAMTISLFYFAFWAIMRGANFARPSAFHRGYVIIWLFVLGWAALTAVTVSEDRLKIGAGYIFVFLESALFLSAFISLLELLALPNKLAWGQQVLEDHEARDLYNTLSGSREGPSQLPVLPRQELVSSPSPTRGSTASTSAAGPTRGAHLPDEVEDEAQATERTPLIGGGGPLKDVRTTFTTGYHQSISALVNTARKHEEDGEPYEHEQPWSGHLPSWAWFFQFLILGPFIIILAAQSGLMLSDAVHQTGSDGSSLFLPYLIIFFFTLLVLLPLMPFIHRVTHHIPLLLLVVFIATLVYNLAAFPFSANNRYKAFFIQRINLDTGENKVCYSGMEDYIRDIIAELPSASGRQVTCGKGLRADLVSCCYDGSEVAPRLSTKLPDGIPPEKSYSNLVHVNVTRGEGNGATIKIQADNSKACFLEFKKPVSGFSVEDGTGWDDRFGEYPEGGVNKIKLWHRNWNVPWVVHVEWKDNEAMGDGEVGTEESGLDGTVMCAWSDANVPNTIPALDEALKYSPAWVAITKTAEGLVEGRKAFKA